MRNSKILFALVASTLLATPALAQSGPIFSKSGGVGSASSTYSGGEPTGGTYSINGTTGGATFNSVTSNTPIPVTSGGTGANTPSAARTAIGAAASGSNSDITSLSGLTTALSVPQGGTGTTTSTGTGSVVRSISPVLVTPNLGTPSAVNLSNGTALPLGTGVTGTLPLANGGTGATTAPTARTALGLGTAATQNIGTAGSNVPLLSNSNTFSADQNLIATGGGLSLRIGVDAGQIGQVILGTGASPRWVVAKAADPESGSNAGSSLGISRYSDAGVALGTALAIDRATGTVNLEKPLPATSGGTGAASVGSNQVFAAPSGSTGTPSFRSLALPDLPFFQNPAAAPVSRPINDKLADIINVKDFGAVCNGSTDDAAAIGNALGYAASIGSGIVELPATGLCKISSTLTVPANVTLRGKGGVTSGLVAGVTNMNPMVALSGNYSSIERMFIDAGTAGVNTSGLVILTNNITSPIIRDLRIDRSCGAIQVNGILANVSNVYAFNSEGTSCSVIQIGNATTLSGTVNAKFDHVQVTSVNTSNRPAYCWDIKDVGGLFITHSDAIYCDVGTIIRPGANQQVIWATLDNTYLGDTNATDGFVIQPAAASGQVKGLNCTACWSSSSGRFGVNITNPSGGLLNTLNFTGLRSFGTGGNAVNLGASANLRISSSFICGYATTGIFADTNAGEFQVADTTIRPDCAGLSSAGVFGVLFAGNNNNVSLTGLDTRNNATAGVAGTPGARSFVSNVSPQSFDNGTIASAATLNLQQIIATWAVTGTTTVSNIGGAWSGREVRLITTTGSVSFTTGGNICNALTSTQNVPVLATYVGSCWFLK